MADRKPETSFLASLVSKEDRPNDAPVPAEFSAILQTHPEFANVVFTPIIATGMIDTTPEKTRIANRLEGFNTKDNDIWTTISEHFGSGIKQQELLSIATVLAKHANIRLDRDAKRRKAVLIKWFAENWTAVSPFLSYVVLEDRTEK
jgi:hypothetical protein